MKIFFAFLILIIFESSTVFSQVSKPGTPRSFSENRGKHSELFVSKAFKMPYQINTEKEWIRIRALEDSAQLGFVPTSVGIAVDMDVIRDGAVYDLANGGKLYLVGVASPGARQLQLLFERYKIPKGAELFIYNKNRSKVLGAFTSENNHESKALAIQFLKGDSLTVEYYEPKNAEFPTELIVKTIVHELAASDSPNDSTENVRPGARYR